MSNRVGGISQLYMCSASSQELVLTILHMFGSMGSTLLFQSIHGLSENDEESLTELTKDLGLKKKNLYNIITITINYNHCNSQGLLNIHPNSPT